MPAFPVGIALLARLAVDQPQQGRGVGAMLLAEALRMAVAAGRSLPHASSWWMLSTKTRLLITSGTVSS